MIYNTLHRKLEPEQHESYLEKVEDTKGVNRRKTDNTMTKRKRKRGETGNELSCSGRVSTSCSAWRICQFYRGCHIYFWRKSESPEKTSDQLQVPGKLNADIFYKPMKTFVCNGHVIFVVIYKGSALSYRCHSTATRMGQTQPLWW
jgi:hypothetical protein